MPGEPVLVGVPTCIRGLRWEWARQHTCGLWQMQMTMMTMMPLGNANAASQ